jgi:predicted RNase H-like nuclease (RuvC/YqgF family)
MDPSLITLIVGILAFLGGIISIIISRRKIKSEAHAMDADAFGKFQESLTKLQERNDELYQENVKLQISVTDMTRTNENMRIRLEERDAQLTATTRQLDLLRELARTAPITDTLTAQLESMNHIVENMQAAHDTLQALLKDRERAYKELFESTRGLTRPNPGEKQIGKK